MVLSNRHRQTVDWCHQLAAGIHALDDGVEPVAGEEDAGPQLGASGDEAATAPAPQRAPGGPGGRLDLA